MSATYVSTLAAVSGGMAIRPIVSGLVRRQPRIVSKTESAVKKINGKDVWISGTRLYIRQGFRKVSILPPTDTYVVEIGSATYAEDMSAYRELARQSLSDLKVHNKLLKS